MKAELNYQLCQQKQPFMAKWQFSVFESCLFQFKKKKKIQAGMKSGLPFYCVNQQKYIPPCKTFSQLSMYFFTVSVLEISHLVAKD